MSTLLMRALKLEFPKIEPERLLLEHPDAHVTKVNDVTYVLIPIGNGRTIYYTHRQQSLHRCNQGVPRAFRRSDSVTPLG